jgi:hypothetical protein
MEMTEMFAGVGYSDDVDSKKAARIAAEQAVQQSGDPDITFLFTTDNYDQNTVLDTVNDICGSKLVGASTPGIITDRGVLRRGVGVCTIRGVTAETHLQEKIGSWKDGRAAGEFFRDKFDSGTVFVFPDGFADNISAVLRGLYGLMGPEFTYLGGGSGDNLKFLRTYQFTERGVSSGSMAVAVVDGMQFSAGVGHGWEPVGDFMIVTKAKGKVVQEIDGRKAFDVYSDILGGIDRDSFHVHGMKYPVGISCTACGFLIRDPVDVSEDGSIVFVTEVPQNTIVTLMECTFDELLATAEDVARVAVENARSPEIAFVFDCVSRYLLLDQKFDEELKTVRSVTGDLPMIGMLTFGEVYGAHKVPMFHNKSIVVAVGGR